MPRDANEGIERFRQRVAMGAGLSEVANRVAVDIEDAQAALDEIDRLRPPFEAAQRALADARDELRSMFRRWHTSGPHATHDAPTIEKAILALDAALSRWEVRR